MRILFLGYSNSPIIHFLRDLKHNVKIEEQKIDVGYVKDGGFDFLISYGYRYILPIEIIELFPKGRAINMHISYLPWNRGAHPNIWSIWEDTPKGVTIHCLDKGLDTGDILIQKEVHFKDNYTLGGSYNELIEILNELFCKSWYGLSEGLLEPEAQIGKGSYHNVKQSEALFQFMPDKWHTTIKKFLQSRLTT